jgi:hypothetical protein
LRNILSQSQFSYYQLRVREDEDIKFEDAGIERLWGKIKFPWKRKPKQLLRYPHLEIPVYPSYSNTRRRMSLGDWFEVGRDIKVDLYLKTQNRRLGTVNNWFIKHWIVILIEYLLFIFLYFFLDGLRWLYIRKYIYLLFKDLVSRSLQKSVCQIEPSSYRFYQPSYHHLLESHPTTAASYAPKVGICELRITKKRFTKVLIV